MPLWSRVNCCRLVYLYSNTESSLNL
jgi:hypothetical protein